MSDFKVTYLGVGSATPSLIHYPSSQIVDFRGKLLMLDCGEGAQLGMRRYKLKFSRLEHIFISHLHGDHFFGLPGLLSTLALHDVGGKITVHLPVHGCDWLRMTMNEFCIDRPYELEIIPIPPKGGVLLDEDSFRVIAFPLNHRLPCTGFRIDEKPKPRHLIGEMVKWLNIPVKDLKSIKDGADYVNAEGKIFLNEQLTTPPSPSGSYAYCSDTAYFEDVVEHLHGIDTLFHETTYLESDRVKATQRYHSTAKDAVKIAVASGAKRLVMGHYSKSYRDTEMHIVEAREEADRLGSDIDIVAANEGMAIDIPYKK